MPETSLSIPMTLGLAILVMIVGMPHGGLDHLVGRAVFRPFTGSWWRFAFAASYLGIAAIVVLGWFVAPLATVVGFFLISAFHFGEGSRADGPLAMIEGGMVIWLPLLARPTEVAELLTWVIPNGRFDWVVGAIQAIQPLVWAIGLTFVGHLIGIIRRGGQTLRVILLLAFALLFAMVPVLVGFVVYFCGWHSSQEMATLARSANPNHFWQGMRTVIIQAAPRAAVVVVVIGLAAWRFADGRELQPVIVQAMFLGLSAVAVPHIVLGAVSQRLGVNPFDRKVMI